VRKTRSGHRLWGYPLLLVILICGCSKGSAPAPPPPGVLVAPAIERTVQDWDEYTGKFAAVDSVEVRPRVSGYIDKVFFKEGAVVHEGDVLVEIDPRPYQADANRARAEWVRAKTQLQLAQIELARVRKLMQSGAVSREEVDERTSTLQEQDANVAATRAALDVAELNLGFTRVTAPVTGRISRAEVTRGNLVTGGNNGGTLLTTVVSVDPIYVYFEADENAYLKYVEMAKAGTRPSSRDNRNPVLVGLANETDDTHRGYIDFVDNQLSAETGTIRARAVVENKDGALLPGLFARVRTLGSGTYPAVLVADTAIATDQSQKYVMVIDDRNVAHYRKVTPGRLIDGLRVVRTGLSAGERVVVSGIQRVQPGMPVTPQVTQMIKLATASPSTEVAR
jgi:RND family efflux transporter MFP subunit